MTNLLVSIGIWFPMLCLAALMLFPQKADLIFDYYPPNTKTKELNLEEELNQALDTMYENNGSL